MEKEMISIVDVAFSMKSAKDEYGMKIADHKLICKVLDAHTRDMDDINKLFHEKIISDVVEVIKNELRPINESLQGIRTDLKKIETKVNSLDKDIKIVKKVQKDHSTRIERLENNFNIIFEEHLKNHKPKSAIRI